jgi:hypothetical protein
MRVTHMANTVGNANTMGNTAQALRQHEYDQQLALYGRMARARRPVSDPHTPMCAGCRAREARYGFRDEVEPLADRPRTLCFDCFRMEINRRQAVAARLARGWNAQQVSLPLEETLNALAKRRRRAQIAARHALEGA